MKKQKMSDYSIFRIILNDEYEIRYWYGNKDKNGKEELHVALWNKYDCLIKDGEKFSDILKIIVRYIQAKETPTLSPIIKINLERKQDGY